MQLLDRDIAPARRDAATMLAATLRQRTEAGAATAAASSAGALRTRPESRQPVQFTERDDEALRRADDGRLAWSLR